MANKYILVVRDGEIVRVHVPKPQFPHRTLAAWRRNCWVAASSCRVNTFLLRFDNQWHVMHALSNAPIKSFPDEARDAAEMYLIHRSRSF